MSTRPQAPEPAAAAYVSTGHLPPPEQVSNLVAEACERYRSNTEGQNSQVAAELRPDLHGPGRSDRPLHQVRLQARGLNSTPFTDFSQLQTL
jgi:hypothetical protein